MAKKRWITILRIGISVILLVIVLKLADFDKIVKVLDNFNQLWLLPIFFLIFISVILSAIKWNTIIKAQEITIRTKTLISYYNCGLFFNNFLPSSIGGDGIRIFLAGRKTDNFSAAASSVIMERTIATASLAFLGLVSSVFAKEPSKLALNLLAVIFTIGIAAVLILITGWVPEMVKARDGKLSRAWIRFANSSRELKTKRKELILCFIQSILFQVVVALVIGAIILGLGQPILNLPDLFLITSASSVMAMIPLGLNGYGMREGAYIYLLKPFGYTTSEAATISILFAFFVLLYSLTGGINWLFISRQIGNTKNLTKSEIKTQ